LVSCALLSILWIIYSYFPIQTSNQTELEKQLTETLKQELNIDESIPQKRLKKLPELVNNAYNQASNCLDNLDNNNCETVPEGYNGFKGVVQSQPYEIKGKQVYDQVKVVLETETKQPLFVTILIAVENQEQDDINKRLSEISKDVMCKIYEKNKGQKCSNLP
jgi:hypothetical protein